MHLTTAVSVLRPMCAYDIICVHIKSSSDLPLSTTVSCPIVVVERKIKNVWIKVFYIIIYTPMRLVLNVMALCDVPPQPTNHRYTTHPQQWNSRFTFYTALRTAKLNFNALKVVWTTCLRVICSWFYFRCFFPLISMTL